MGRLEQKPLAPRELGVREELLREAGLVLRVRRRGGWRWPVAGRVGRPEQGPQTSRELGVRVELGGRGRLAVIGERHRAQRLPQR